MSLIFVWVTVLQRCQQRRPLSPPSVGSKPSIRLPVASDDQGSKPIGRPPVASDDLVHAAALTEMANRVRVRACFSMRNLQAVRFSQFCCSIDLFGLMFDLISYVFDRVGR